MIISDFWQPFCVGKNNGSHKARPRKTTIARRKRLFLDSSWAVKLFAGLTKLSWSGVRDTCVSSRHFFLAQKSAKNHWISWHCPFKIPATHKTSAITLVHVCICVQRNINFLEREWLFLSHSYASPLYLLSVEPINFSCERPGHMHSGQKVIQPNFCWSPKWTKTNTCKLNFHNYFWCPNETWEI